MPQPAESLAPCTSHRSARPGARWRVALLSSLWGLFGVCAVAQAQSFCSSDGQPKPTALLERFIGADCEGCWNDPATARPARGAVALDWIVPSARGDEAPLSAAARRDASDRLTALGRSAPQPAEHVQSTVQATRMRATLRVAHGLPFNDYVAASLEIKPGSAVQRSGAATAWLVLVEAVPAGTEGTPVARNVVRNAFQRPWDGRIPLSKDEQTRIFEQRSFYLPEGTRAERLRVIGWVADAQGRVLAAAQSRCAEGGR